MSRDYTYDGAGNRELESDLAGFSRDYVLTDPSAKVHQYSQTIVDTETTVWAYDNSGNLEGLSSGGTFAYNAQNRMAEYVPGPGNRDAERWEYVYDGFGRRVRKLHVVGGEVAAYFDYAYDGDQVIAEYASTAADPGEPERTFVYGAYVDEPIPYGQEIGSTAKSHDFNSMGPGCDSNLSLYYALAHSVALP